ncbi:uncharacterized protein LOC135838481 [Planococcus citri]|uniref:uncharacterized protein LOC135838481 n=1 Tax=Planococcus citri TaxID=170843 RepID=UPI0031F84A41
MKTTKESYSDFECIPENLETRVLFTRSNQNRRLRMVFAKVDCPIEYKIRNAIEQMKLAADIEHVYVESEFHRIELYIRDFIAMSLAAGEFEELKPILTSDVPAYSNFVSSVTFEILGLASFIDDANKTLWKPSVNGVTPNPEPTNSNISHGADNSTESVSNSQSEIPAKMLAIEYPVNSPETDSKEKKKVEFADDTKPGDNNEFNEDNDWFYDDYCDDDFVTDSESEEVIELLNKTCQKIDNLKVTVTNDQRCVRELQVQLTRCDGKTVNQLKSPDEGIPNPKKSAIEKEYSSIPAVKIPENRTKLLPPSHAPISSTMTIEEVVAKFKANKELSIELVAFTSSQPSTSFSQSNSTNDEASNTNNPIRVPAAVPIQPSPRYLSARFPNLNYGEIDGPQIFSNDLVDRELIPICEIVHYIPYNFPAEYQRITINWNPPDRDFPNHHLRLWNAMTRGTYVHFKIVIPRYHLYRQRQTFEWPRIHLEAVAWRNHLNLVRRTFRNEIFPAIHVVPPIWSYNRDSSFDFLLTILGKIHNDNLEIIFDPTLEVSLINDAALTFFDPYVYFNFEVLDHAKAIYVPWLDEFRLVSRRTTDVPIKLTPDIHFHVNETHSIKCHVVDFQTRRKHEAHHGTVIIGRQQLEPYIISYDPSTVILNLSGPPQNTLSRSARCKVKIPEVRSIGIMRSLSLMTRDQLQFEFQPIERYLIKHTRGGR